jgi:hypothetical protein
MNAYFGRTLLHSRRRLFLDVSLFIHTLEFRAKLTHLGLLVIVLLTLLLDELRFDPAVSQGTGCYGLTSQQPEAC